MGQRQRRGRWSGVFLSGQSTLANCTIVYNAGYGIKSLAASSEVANSILFFNGGGGPQVVLVPENPGVINISHSDVQNGFGGQGNINLNPIFQGRSNFMLVIGSPCIDRGDTNAIHNDVCFPPSRGSVRNDMGAYGGPGACDWITGDEPVILVQPKSRSTCLGQDATFWIRAVGPEPLGYQWYFNGTNAVPGQTSSNLVLTALQAEQAGYYSVVVTNRFGSAISDAALLQLSDACVDIHLYAGLSITGLVGRTYTLHYTTDLGQTNSWISVATNTFADPFWFYLDRDTPFVPRRFYRVDLMR